MSRGALIIFEGCDRSGKTTQCKKLVEALNAEGHKTKFMRFPERDTPIGQVINSYLEKKCELEDHAVHLLFAANRWEFEPEMKDLLNEGTTLIVDRYSFSGVAFSSAKPMLSLDWCIPPEVGLPKPDAVLYLNLSLEEAAKRGSFGEERYEQTDFQREVAKNYEVLKKQDWKVIDASKSVEDLHEELKSVVKNIIEESKGKSIGTLWTTDTPQSASKRKCPSDPNPLAEKENEIH